jgi:hypothetical protein
MQPIQSIETINHSSNLNSKNTRRQIKQLTRWFICRSLESPPVIPVSPLRKLELLIRPTPRQVSFNRFPHFTSSCFFPFKGEANLHKLFQDSSHAWESRATPSHLGSFTSKSNRCYKDWFTKLKCSSTHKEDSLNPSLRISHKSQDPHKERMKRAHKGLEWIYFVGSTNTLQRRGEAFILVPQKLAIGN